MPAKPGATVCAQLRLFFENTPAQLQLTKVG